MASSPLLRSSALLVPLLLVALTASYGCGTTCEQVRADFEQAKQAEIAQTSDDEDSDERPPHFAIALRTSFIETLASDFVGATLRGALQTARSLDVAGSKALKVQTLPKIENFSLDRRKDTCAHCFQFSGKLDGSLEVEIPILGTRKVPMNGNFEFVAPVTLGPGPDDNTGALFVDLGEAVRTNAAPVALSISGLRDTWTNVIEKALTTQLADDLVGKLEPVRILTFKMPKLGIKGFSMQPAGLRIDDKGEAVKALFTTSLPIAGVSDADRLAAAAQPAKDKNLAVAFPLELVVGAVAQGMRNGEIGRRYTTKGEATNDGPFHVTVSRFETTESTKDGFGYEFGFRAWHMGDTGPCFWFDGLADGAIAAKDDAIGVTLDGVSFSDTSRSNLALNAANWASAQFLKSGVRVAEASLSKENVELPSGKLGFSGLKLGVADGIISFSAVAALEKKPGDS